MSVGATTRQYGGLPEWQTATPPWVLKGGHALEVKFGMAGTTKALDLVLDRLLGSLGNWRQHADALLEILQEASPQPLDDFFPFVLGEPIQEVDAAPSNRTRHAVEAILDRRTFFRFHFDIGSRTCSAIRLKWSFPGD